MEDIAVVLVETSHPGNLGAAARAMRTMGLHEMRLVNPTQAQPDHAIAVAAGGQSVLEQAKRYPTLAEALADTQIVFATSARPRELSHEVMSPRQAAAYLAQVRAQGQKAAVVFGRESSGLSNQEMLMCQKFIHIPSDESYGVLNLSHAVQIICYEIHQALDEIRLPEQAVSDEDKRASVAMKEEFYTAFEKALRLVGFLHQGDGQRLLARLRILFERADLRVQELQILRGFLASLDKKWQRVFNHTKF